MRILEEIGIEFYNEEAIEILREAGCTIEGDNVRMGRDFVMEMVAKAPTTFSITPRNPNRTIEIGGKNHGVRQRVFAAELLGYGDRHQGSRQPRDVPKPVETDTVFQLYSLCWRLSG